MTGKVRANGEDEEVKTDDAHNSIVMKWWGSVISIEEDGSVDRTRWKWPMKTDDSRYRRRSDGLSCESCLTEFTK